ncbi:MAG: DUF3160 domain-containing protein [Armatimonadetes bacterium]|nr:DUF3160 domain-containing protein [Armatimonadota bacterium]MDW8027726.1 DUF3160 domain-containing protein [Armatimonadota bacterium]
MLEKAIWLSLALLFTAAYLSAQPANLPRVVALMNLSEQAKQRLLRDGILFIADWSETNLWKAYDDLRRFHIVPIFVTTDACLYQFYELHKAAVRDAETQGFLPLLKQLVRDWAETAYKAMSTSQFAKDVKHAAFVLAAAGKLLDDKFQIPIELQAQVNATVSEIVLAQRVVEGYPFGEDFTQYKPRGHYTRSDELKRYFRAFKWLARRVYDAQKTDQLRQVVTLLWLLEQTPNGLERYRILVNAIVSLAGEPVGMPLTELRSAIKAIGLQTSQVLSDNEALEALRNELAKPEYGQARIVTHPVPAIAMSPPQLMPEKQIRPLPEIQLPDSEVLQWTSDPQITLRIPSGLDVAAALGSQRAIELLRQAPNGDLVLERIKPFAQTWSQLTERDWQKSVYRIWLWAIKAVLEIDEQTPKFMRTPVWQDWKLNTALASWAQLRHAYGLYAAPVYEYAGMVEIPPAYLEPNPKCYERLALATEKLREVLSEAKVLSENMDSHLRKFSDLMRRFVAIAEKERRGEPLSKTEAEMLALFADAIARLPRETPVTVIDILTHSQFGQVLHVASGKLHPVLVIVDAKPYEPFVAVGWSLSYYEFTRPNFERMTNADWEKWLERDANRPEPPIWANSFRWSAHEELEGFAELRHAESFLATNPNEGVRLLLEVAQKHEGKWVGAKARLLLARHFVESQKFEEAQRELEAFYRSSNMRLMKEADEICLEAQWDWKRWTRWQKAQPYLQRLLQLTEQPQKPLPKTEEQRRQDLRAETLLLQIDLLPPKLKREKVSDIVAQILRECPQSRLVPTAKAISWWFRIPIFEQPTEQQRRQILDEALKIINEHSSSVAAWFVANSAWEFVQSLAEAKSLINSVSKLRPPSDEFTANEETQLLSIFALSMDVPSSFNRPPINFEKLAWLYAAEGDFERAWEAAQRAKDVDQRLRFVLEAWKQEGSKVGTLLLEIDRAWMEDDNARLVQICETFVKKFPKSRFAPSILRKAIDAFEKIGDDEKARTLANQLISQFPKSAEAKRLIQERRERERFEREQITATENFVFGLLKGTKVDLRPYLAVAKTDLSSALDKLISEHPELKEQIVKRAMDEVERKHETEGKIWVANRLRDWLIRHFCERYPDNPLAYEVRWRLQIKRLRHVSLEVLPMLAPFLSAPEGIPYREEAEKLLEQVLAERPERTERKDPFFQLLEYAEQLPTLKPRLLLEAGRWAMEGQDWETAKNLLMRAAKEGDEKISQRANELLAQLERLRQQPQKVVKRLWEMDLWQLQLPPPQKAEDCLRALRVLSSLFELVRELETDGRWLAFETSEGLICVDLLKGKVVWKKPPSWQRNIMVMNNTVILLTSTWQPKSGEVKEATALDAATGKVLWKRKFVGKRIAFVKQQGKLGFAHWQDDLQKGKFVLINPYTGKQEFEKPITWQEFVDWQWQMQGGARHPKPRAFLTDEQGRLVAMWICERHWKSPDNKTIVVLFPDGKLSAYSIAQ